MADRTMIKVECLSCRAPYELDPKRIPDKGMKMRCPKCGTSFMVSKQGATSAVGANASAAEAPAAAPKPIAPPPLIAPPPALGAVAAPKLNAPLSPPLASGVPKATMLGHRAAEATAANDAAPMTKMKTAMGVAPPSAVAAAPVVQGRAPIAPAFPQAPVAVASASSRGAAAKGAFGATMMGVAAQAQIAQPDPEEEDLEADLPALREDPLSGLEEPLMGSEVELPTDLPALKPSHEAQDLSVSRIYVEDLPAPKREVDLPAPRGQIAVNSGTAPALRGAVNSGTAPALRGGAPLQPAPESPAAPGAFNFGDLDLPAPKVSAPAKPAAASAFGDLDLPAPKVRADLPALKGGADLPAPKGIADLPAPRGVTDLPAPRGVADLPAAKGGTDLPAPRGVADLPTPKTTVDLPMRKGGEDLPSPKAGVSSFGDIDLPVPKLSDPPVRNTAVTARRDESSFADLEIELPDLPGTSEPPARDVFGDIELPPPKASAGLVAPKEKTVQGMGAGKQTLADESSFGDVDFDNDGDSDLPPSLLGEDESSFGDVDIGGPPSAPRPPPPRPPGPKPRMRTEDIEELEPDAEEMDDLGEADDFGEEEFAAGADDDSEDEEDQGSDEEMEFGISGDEAARGLAIPPEMLRKQRGEEFEAKQAERGRRSITILVRVAILLVLLIGGGAGLTFTEYGVFGIYYWERWLPEAGDPQFARQAIEKSEKLASSDTYVDVRRSLKELGQARRKAGLNRELLTRSLLHESMLIIRFGDDPTSAAHVGAIMKRLEERSFRAPGMQLARAADAARRKKWSEVQAPLEQARGEGHVDPYVELLSGEVALATGKLAEADKAFGKALQLGAGTRAQWGLARTAMMRSDVDAQVAAVNETLKLSPMHVEARIAEARILWSQGKEDRALHLLRVAIGLEPTEEEQYLWTSKAALAAGYSLLGYIHESRGRLHNARESYEQALAADPYRVDALLGSGRVLLREKRYADAQARFESALSSATKGGDNPIVLSGRTADAEAKLGIGRAMMSLQQGAQAKATMTELSTKLPNDAEVVLALGEAEQTMGNVSGAETLFRKSIELAPKRFDGYLSLSQLFFKKGDAGKASEVLNEAASKVEETAEMRRMLGQSELARNRLESGIHEFKRALELDPHDMDAMFGMGIALRKSGDLAGAGRALGEITKRDPGFAGLAEQSGLLFEAQGDFKKAVDAYRAALEKDPGDNSLLLRLGAAQVSAGDYDTAEQTLAKVVREMPNSAEGEYFIGRIAFARGRTPDALTHFDRAVGLDGTRGEFHLYVARASLEMGNLGRTLDEVQAALSSDPNQGDAYWVRATVRLRMGAVKDALSDLNKALRLNPARTDAYAVQGDCYEQLRDLPDAITAYRTALTRDPARGEWWYRSAMLHADSGNRAEADTSVKRAIEIGDKTDPFPYWLPDSYRLAGENAEMRGDHTGAIRLFKRYVEIAPPTAIDRGVIEKKLKGWGVELEDEE
jgi:predicted Zn finger-like uncharacterized protein